MCHLSLFVHSQCMHDHLNTASHPSPKKKKSFHASSCVLWKRSSSSARVPVFQASPLVAWAHVHELFAFFWFHPCLWPPRKSPEFHRPRFSSYEWLTGFEFHGTFFFWQQTCPCSQVQNCLSQEERRSWFGLRLRSDICVWLMGLASLWPGGVSHLLP